MCKRGFCRLLIFGVQGQFLRVFKKGGGGSVTFIASDFLQKDRCVSIMTLRSEALERSGMTGSRYTYRTNDISDLAA